MKSEELLRRIFLCMSGVGLRVESIAVFSLCAVAECCSGLRLDLRLRTGLAGREDWQVCMCLVLFTLCVGEESRAEASLQC